MGTVGDGDKYLPVQPSIRGLCGRPEKQYI